MSHFRHFDIKSKSKPFACDSDLVWIILTWWGELKVP